MHHQIIESVIQAGKELVNLVHVSNALQYFLIAFVVVGTGYLALRTRKH